VEASGDRGQALRYKLYSKSKSRYMISNKKALIIMNKKSILENPLCYDTKMFKSRYVCRSSIKFTEFLNAL
jgi:hypothetical protein